MMEGIGKMLQGPASALRGKGIDWTGLDTVNFGGDQLPWWAGAR